MLKHATPRSSPSLHSTTPSPSPQHTNRKNQPRSTPQTSQGDSLTTSHSNSTPPKTCVNDSSEPTYNERSVDCDGIVSQSACPVKKGPNSCSGLRLGSFLGEKILSLGSLSSTGSGIGPVITHGKAIVRRGLSFNSKKDCDTVSVRSVKSEGQGGEGGEDAKRQTLGPQKARSVMTLQSQSDVLPKNFPPPSQTKEEGEREIEGLEEASKENCPVVIQAPGATRGGSTHKKGGLRSSTKKIFGLSKSDHPSLKSLLRLPGVYGHIPVPENVPCGTPHILSPDSLSLNSSDSFVSSNSGRTSSRSWSSSTSSNSNHTSDSSNSNCSSTSEPTSTTLKIFAKCLRSDIEYKTVNIGSRITCRQLITLLLSKARMRHRDPNLFYLTMEVTVRRWSGVPVRALLVLEESARPTQLALCRPSGDLKFVLQMRKGGVIKIHDTVLMPGSQYKSLLVSHRTTSEEAVQLLLNCYGRRESKHYYALHEVCQSPNYSDRRLAQTEKPLDVKAEWPRDRKAEFVFVLRRNMTQALSLRKLSLRTLEQRNNKDVDRVTGSTLPVITDSTPDSKLSKDVQQNVLRETNKLAPETLMIDCTSTTPVMLALVRTEDQHSYTYEGGGGGGTGTRGGTANTQRTLNQRIEPPQNPVKIPLLASIDTAKPPITLSTQNVVKDENENKNKKNVSPNQKELPNRWHNKVSFHSLPKLEKPSLSVSNGYKIPPPKRHESDDIYLDYNCLSKLSKVNPQYYLPKPRSVAPLISSPLILSKAKQEPLSTLLNKRAKIVSTSSVQTELTCISLKGLKTRHKWNSVETLLDTQSSSQIRMKDAQTQLFASPKKPLLNGVSGRNAEHKKEVTENGNNKEIAPNTNSNAHKHSPGRHCNCENCFYI